MRWMSDWPGRTMGMLPCRLPLTRAGDFTRAGRGVTTTLIADRCRFVLGVDLRLSAGATSNSVEYDFFLLSNIIFMPYSPHIHLIFTSYSDGEKYSRI